MTDEIYTIQKSIVENSNRIKALEEALLVHNNDIVNVGEVLKEHEEWLNKIQAFINKTREKKEVAIEKKSWFDILLKK